MSTEVPASGEALLWDADRSKWVPTAAVIQFTDTQLTNSQVLNFRAIPITVVPAPGADLVLLLHRVWIVSDDSAGAWTETSDNLIVEYAGGENATVQITGSGLVGGAVQTRSVPITAGNLITEVNVALQLFNTGDGEWGGGDAANTMSVRCFYSVVPAVAFS